MGFVFAILTGILFGLQGFAGKSATVKLPITVLSWATFSGALPYFLLSLSQSQPVDINWQPFILATATSIAFNLLAFNLFFRALEADSLSLTMPFTAFTPVFLMPFAYFSLGELPNTSGFVGLLLMVFGAYGIYLKSNDLWQPIRSIASNRGSRFMLLAAMVWSVTATAEKVAIINSSPDIYGTAVYSGLSLALLPWVWHRHPAQFHFRWPLLKTILVMGSLTGLMGLCQFRALETIDVSYVIAFKRGGIIWAIILGYFLLGERQIWRNLLMSVLILLGALLVMI